MTAATKDILTDQFGTPEVVLPQKLNFPVAAATTLYAGTFAATDASGNLVATPTASSKIWGRIERQVVNTVAAGYGGAGDLSAEINQGYFFPNNDSTNACTNAMRGSFCYVVDNNTVGSSDVGGSLPVAGVIVNVPASGDVEYGKVCVAVGMGSPYLLNPELASSSTAFKARNVATNLAALTFTAGAFEADANGALGAQDGITNVAGDVIFFPAGTITTGVVSAANSGPWVLTSVGGAGKFAGIRPDWWPHAGTFTLAAAINIGEGTLFGGTNWPSFAAKGGTIGTTDPKLYPRQVTQQLTLVAGTTTIANVPIFATARVGLAVGLVGGTPDATTTAYNFRITSGRVAGGIGTASAIIDATATAGGAKVAGDVSVVNITLING